MKLKDVNSEIKEITSIIETFQSQINDYIRDIKYLEGEQIKLKAKIDKLKNIEVKTGSILK